MISSRCIEENTMQLKNKVLKLALYDNFVLL